MNKLMTSAGQIDFNIADLPAMPEPQRVLMVEPTYYNVDYVINPHMIGQVGTVKRERAQKEWEQLASSFQKIGLEVIKLAGVPGLPDMVFSANQSLPFLDKNNRRKVIMSIMHTRQRAREVGHIEKWYHKNGYDVFHLNPDNVEDFEGMGDAIWHFKRKLIWGGYGFRTSRYAYEQISEIFDVPVILLPLKDERFYHLDTCFCSLDENNALIYPPAFDESGLEMIYKVYENVIEAPAEEAIGLFAVNATCPDGKNVLIQKGCTEVARKLNEHGFIVHEMDTREFLKSGGSVYCMKMLLW
ncbi:MAG: arginine deiminase-related protein [Balneolaceae bacterium]